MRRLVFGIVTLLLLALATPAAADTPRPGAVDPSFPVSANGIGRGYLSSLSMQGPRDIVLGGGFSMYTGPRNLIRVNPAGKMDTSFEKKGPWSKGAVRSITPQPDGKLLLAGYFQGHQMLRVQPDGARDRSFDPLPTYKFVSLLGNGKIMATGETLTRLRPNGTVDDSFTSDLPASISSAVELPGGDLLAMGWGSPAVTRLNPDGSRDRHFSLPAELQTATWAGSPVVRPNGRVSMVFRPGAGTDAVRVGLEPDGSLDPEFQPVAENNSHTAAIGLPDGKILTSSDTQVYRLNPDGTRDPSFQPLPGTAWALQLAQDGTVAIGAYVSDARSSEVVHLLNPDGSPRDLFAVQGGGFDEAVDAVAALPRGEVLAGGAFSRYDGRAAPNLTVLTSDGRQDPAFRVRGAGLQGPSVAVDAVAVQRDGKYLIGGAFDGYNGFSTRSLVRLDPDGSRDLAFSPAAFSGHVDEVLVQRNGKILVGGSFRRFGRYRRPYLARLNRDGTLDRSFHPPLHRHKGAMVDAITEQRDGKILVGGFRMRPTLLRLNKDGTRDTSFARGVDKPTERVSVITVQPDDKILIGGRFSTYNGKPVGQLTRLRPNGKCDRSFAPAGLDFRVPKWAGTAVNSIAVQPNGKVLVGGPFKGLNGQNIRRLVRLKPNGTRDRTFRQRGKGLGGHYVTTLLRRTDGKIVVGGDFTDYNARPYGRLVQLIG